MTSSRTDFSSPADESLKKLNDACDAATFGLNRQDVLDETYRKAGKLDSLYFTTNFDPLVCGLLDRLEVFLLEGHTGNGIRAELYKLNVYGPGSFFKVHKDTPRGGDMFASLVIVLPTPHVGGPLQPRHGDPEHTFDSATAVSQSTIPCVRFAAFFSDVDHEVLAVETGYRVTITYNLYYRPRKTHTLVGKHADIKFVGDDMSKATLKSCFDTLLSNPTVFPEGGYIGFGLCHEYPVGASDGLPSLSRLKGRDAVLVKVCEDLSLDASIQVVYYHPSLGPVLCEESFYYNDTIDSDTDWDFTLAFAGMKGKLLAPPEGYDQDGPLHVARVVWATPWKISNICNEIETEYTAWGNEPSIGYEYGTMCLVVKIKEPVAKNRVKAPWK